MAPSEPAPRGIRLGRPAGFRQDGPRRHPSRPAPEGKKLGRSLAFPRVILARATRWNPGAAPGPTGPGTTHSGWDVQNPCRTAAGSGETLSGVASGSAEWRVAIRATPACSARAFDPAGEPDRRSPARPRAMGIAADLRSRPGAGPGDPRPTFRAWRAVPRPAPGREEARTDPQPSSIHSPRAARHAPLATRRSPRATRRSPRAARHAPLATRHSTEPLRRATRSTARRSPFRPGLPWRMIRLEVVRSVRKDPRVRRPPPARARRSRARVELDPKRIDPIRCETSRS